MSRMHSASASATGTFPGAGSTVRLSHVTYTYPGCAEPALRDVSVTFAGGWTGIVGDNGCGKSTLARLAAGELVPDAGSVSPRLSCAFCMQDAGQEPPGLADFACDYGAQACQLRATLGIEDDMPWRFATLSCGEQKKIQVAVALWRGAEVLVVDEPTNHVDAACRTAILSALASFEIGRAHV